MKRRQQRYDAVRSTISTQVCGLGLWVMVMGFWLSTSTFEAIAADPPAHLIGDTVSVRPAPCTGGTNESAEAWLLVDETLRRSTFLPDDVRRQVSDPAADGILAEMAGIEADADRYLADLDEQPPFWGLYFRSGAASDVDHGDTDLNYRLEWDLFKNGHWERKKELKKKRNQSELQTLQVLNDVTQHRLNQQLDDIEFLAQAVRYHQADELAALLAGIMRRRQVQLEKRYIRRDDFDHIRFKYRQAELKKKLYAASRRATLEASLHDLLNRAEFAGLIPLDQAQRDAIDQAYPLKIQQNLIERARYARSWTDDLSLDLYVEQHNDFDDTTRSNVGLEVKIPIHWNTRRGRLIDEEKRLYGKQADVLTRRITTNLQKLYDFFAFQQVRLQMLLLELEKTGQRKAYEQERAERALEDLEDTPERSLDQIRMEEIDLRYEAIQTRLKLYEILVKIAALTHAGHPRDVIAGIQPHCPDR